jgi:hypothetical protein
MNVAGSSPSSILTQAVRAGVMDSTGSSDRGFDRMPKLVIPLTIAVAVSAILLAFLSLLFSRHAKSLHDKEGKKGAGMLFRSAKFRWFILLSPVAVPVMAYLVSHIGIIMATYELRWDIANSSRIVVHYPYGKRVYEVSLGEPLADVLFETEDKYTIEALADAVWFRDRALNCNCCGDFVFVLHRRGGSRLACSFRHEQFLSISGNSMYSLTPESSERLKKWLDETGADAARKKLIEEKRRPERTE